MSLRNLPAPVVVFDTLADNRLSYHLRRDLWKPWAIVAALVGTLDGFDDLLLPSLDDRRFRTSHL